MINGVKGNREVKKYQGSLSVKWPVLYADWYGLSKLLTWICSNSCLAYMYSTSFDMKLGHPLEE